MCRQYRYHTILATNASLDEELKLMDILAIQFLKTYQVWHHRRLILTALHSSDSSSHSSNPDSSDPPPPLPPDNEHVYSSPYIQDG